MARTNGDDDMSSNARNVGSRPLRWEGDPMGRELLTRRWSRRGRGEKLSVDSDRARLQVTFRLAGRGMMVTFRKVAFSSCRVALVVKKEVNSYL